MLDLQTNRRATLKLLAAGTGLLAAPYLARTALAQDKVLNITTYDKFVPKAFIQQFQKETGIEVRIRLTDDQSKQYNLLAAEGGAPSTDIVTVTGNRLSQFNEAGLLAPLDTARIKGWNRLASAYQGAPQLSSGGQTWGLPILAGYEVLVRNTNYTKASDSWEVMFDESYKGLSSYIVSDFLSVVMRYQGNDGDYVTYAGRPDLAQEATNKARDLLIAKKPLVRKYYDSASELQQMFVNEDIHIAQAWSGPVAQLILAGHPAQLTIPKEGTYGFLYSFNVVKNAPNTDAAYRFLDAIISSPEIGAAMTRQTGFASTFAGVEAFLSDRERAANALPDKEAEKIQFFSPVNRKMKNEFAERATAEIKAA